MPNEQTEDLAAKKARLLKEKEEWDKAQSKKEEILEIEALELESKYRSEGKTRGVDYQIVTTSVGNFVVGRPEFVVMKKYNATDKRSDEDVVQLADTCLLFPSRDVARGIFSAHAGVAYRCVGAINDLYGAHVTGSRSTKY